MKRMGNFHARAVMNEGCGDTFEVYIQVKNNRVSHISFCTDGCVPAIECGNVLTELVNGKTFDEILEKQSWDTIKHLDFFPMENIHCAILAVSIFHKAFAEYTLKKVDIINNDCPETSCPV